MATGVEPQSERKSRVFPAARRAARPSGGATVEARRPRPTRVHLTEVRRGPTAIDMSDFGLFVNWILNFVGGIGRGQIST